MTDIALPLGKPSQAIPVGTGALITATPGVGGTVLVEYTEASAADVANGIATWERWPKGIASAKTADVLRTNGFVRARALTAAGSLSIDEAPSAANIAAAAGNEWDSDPSARFNSYPVAVGTWGDSLTDTCNAATHDLTVATTALFDGKDLYNNRLAHALMFYSGGRIIPVANGGVGGTTSSQILARDTAAEGVNRRGAQDVANTGARVCIISIGINDIVTVSNLAATTQAARDAILQGIYTNTATAVRRVQKLGMYPILRELPGYGYENSTLNYASIAGKSPADVAAGVEMIKTAAAYIADVLVPTLGDMTLLRYRAELVDPVTGDWYAKYSTDKLHENRNGVRVIARKIIDVISRMTRPLATDIAYAPLPAGAGRKNAFVAPAMLSVTSGRAAGITSSAGVGAVTIAPSVTTDPDGKVWQDFLITPTAFDGTARVQAPAGLASAVIYLATSIFGATPAVSLAAGELFRNEYDLVIDDGAGGPPSVLTWYSETYIQYPTTWRFRHVEQNSNSANLVFADEPIIGKVMSLPIAAPAASADMTNALIALTTFSGTTVPYRIRISAPRAVKYPAPL